MDLREVVTTTIELIGVALLSLFAALTWMPAAALAVWGVALIIAAEVHGNPPARVRDEVDL
ncbi:hypothetical protein [Angustibacter luteus]|uniref:Uncharacterized protein n=1 Tax=Angustibacter luteus TaxID=658456 RepID=A0ABW1JKA8_9ACTN